MSIDVETLAKALLAAVPGYQRWLLPPPMSGREAAGRMDAMEAEVRAHAGRIAAEYARLVPAEDEREVIEVEGAEGVVHRVWKPAEDEDGPEVEWNSAAQRFVPAEDEGRMREALARASNRLDLYQTHDENCPSPAMGSQCPCSHGRLMAECDRALAATPEPR